MADVVQTQMRLQKAAKEGKVPEGSSDSETTGIENMSLVMRKPALPYANSKGADQPVHLCSLISAFVVHSLDSKIPLVSISEISTSVAAQASLSLPWSQTRKTGFLVMRLI